LLDGDGMSGGKSVPASMGPGEEVWAQQSIWSQVANGLKGSLDRLRTVSLLLTIAAAVLATAAAEVSGVSTDASRVLALLAAVAAALIPVVRNRLNRQQLLDWTEARSISEALKAEIYSFLSGTGPYRGGDRGTLLLARLDEHVGTVGDSLLQARVGIRAVDRPLPPVSDVPSYLQLRVEGQITYYEDTASQLKRRVSWLHGIETILAIVAAVLSAVAATFQVHQASAWVAVVTTVAAALIAHATAARYDYQIAEYERTALTLHQLLVRRSQTASPTPEDDDQFVQRCENSLAQQNRAWVTKWTSGAPQ